MTHRFQASMHDAFQFHGLGTRSRLSRCSRLTAYGGQTRPLGSRLSNSHHHTALKVTLHEQCLLLGVRLTFCVRVGRIYAANCHTGAIDVVTVF